LTKESTMPIACLFDDDLVFRGVRDLLHTAGWDCHRFGSETALLRALCHQRTELVVVATGGDSRLEERILSWVSHRTGEHTPVVMMCANAAAERIARALDAGVEDVVSPSANPLELLARLRCAATRAHRETRMSTLSVGDYTLDRASAQVFDRGAKVPLTAREFAMAWLFFSNQGKTLSRETISVAVWGVGEDITHRTMEQHVYKLRKKLRLSDPRGVAIRALYSQGYRLEVTHAFDGEAAIRTPASPLPYLVRSAAFDAWNVSGSAMAVVPQAASSMGIKRATPAHVNGALPSIAALPAA
jgi:DNA-binding response OmpR family regulator